MEHAVHIFPAVQTIEQGSGDVAHTLADNPSHRCCADMLDEGMEGDEYGKTHQHEAYGFQMAVLFQSDEAGDGSNDGAGPYQTEQ